MNYLIFFLLFPIIYEIIVGFLYFKYGDIDLYFFEIFDSEAISSIFLTLILIAIDYLIEFVYFFICEKIFGQDILLIEYQSIGFELKGFVFFLLIFAIGHLFILIYNIIDWEWFDFAPYLHTIILVMAFIIFSFVMSFSNKICLEQKEIKEMEYSQEENIYELKVIDNDSNQDIYLNMSYLKDGYNIYFSYIDENGETILDIVNYKKSKALLNDTVSIFEKENCEPIVKITRNYKDINGDILEFFYYEFYIPVDSMKEISNLEQ